MTRKANVYYFRLTNDPVEILAHNPKRIAATVYCDGYYGSGIVAIGNTAHQAAVAPAFYASYAPFSFDGTNSLWARSIPAATVPQGITVVELVEE